MRISDWSSDVCSSDLTSCHATATAPTMNTTSPKVRIQRSVSRKPCCRNSSLRAYHMPVVTLASNWNRPTGSRLVKIISTSPAFSPQKPVRSEEHTSELQSLLRSSYAVFCLKKKLAHVHK